MAIHHSFVHCTFQESIYVKHFFLITLQMSEMNFGHSSLAMIERN